MATVTLFPLIIQELEDVIASVENGIHYLTNDQARERFGVE